MPAGNAFPAGERMSHAIYVLARALSKSPAPGAAPGETLQARIRRGYGPAWRYFDRAVTRDCAGGRGDAGRRPETDQPLIFRDSLPYSFASAASSPAETLAGRGTSRST